MNNRTVSQLLYAHENDMDGLAIRQPFPTERVEQIDPFLLLHHGDIMTPEDMNPDHAGVGPHPHRGFSPVTFTFKGGIHHRDSRGNDNVVYAGGAQWMNAGMGIIHSERPPRDIHEIGGRQEFIQLWINTPAGNKMERPTYFPISAENVPTLSGDNGKTKLNLFSGELLSLKGPISSSTEVNAATLEIKEGGKITIPIPHSHNAFIYCLDGKINVDGFGMVEPHHVVLFSNDGDFITLVGLQDTRILLLSGKPLNEKVVSRGPYVMNTETEILEAMRDYRMGRMGILIEE